MGDKKIVPGTSKEPAAGGRTGGGFTHTGTSRLPKRGRDTEDVNLADFDGDGRGEAGPNAPSTFYGPPAGMLN